MPFIGEGSIDLTERIKLFGVSNPVVLVTGSGAARVGQTVARKFANGGYRVVVHANRSRKQGNDLVEEFQANGCDSMFVGGEVQDANCVDSWIDEIIQRFGRLDVVVHTSAVWDPKPLEEVSSLDLSKQVDVNLVGSFLVARSAGLQMVKQPTGGAIILVGDWAIQRPYAGFSAYFLSKGGIPTLARTMAVELAQRNPAIRVNAILPGPVLLSEGATDELRARLRAQSLLNRDGEAQDVANSAFFLAEQPFITGVSLPVDGGRSIFCSSDQDAIAHPDWD